MHLLKELAVKPWQLFVDAIFVQKLKIVDWQQIYLKLRHDDSGRGWNFVQAAIAIWRYGLFLFLLQKYPQIKTIPTEEIDAVLHVHMKDAIQFERDCQILFGGCIQHIVQAEPTTEAKRREWLLAFAQTQALFEKNFGRGTMGTSVAANCLILPCSV